MSSTAHPHRPFLTIVLILACLCALVPLAANAPPPSIDDTARAILRNAGVTGGLIVHIGCGYGRLTAALRVNDACLVHALDTDAETVENARRYIQSLGLYGPVSTAIFDGKRLPYTDNIVKLVVSADLRDVPMQEVMRVLAPGGVAYLYRDGQWRTTVKPRPDDIDEWTHYLHDASGNAVAHDLQIGPPKHLRWRAGPRYCRSHEFSSSISAVVTADGRIFSIIDEGLIGLPDLRFPARWKLVARDAFSGVLLWKRPIPNWGYKQWNTRGLWSTPLTLSRRLVTDGPHVFVTLGYDAPVTVLDAATGDQLRTIPNTGATDEIIVSDGVLLLCVRDQLSVAAPPDKEPEKPRNPHEWWPRRPGPAKLMAIDIASGKQLWSREPETVPPLSLAATDGRICFSDRQQLKCLDLRTGKPIWATECPARGYSRHTVGTLLMNDDVVLFTAKDGLAAFSVQTGEKLWTGPTVHGPAVANPPDLFVADGLLWCGRTKGGYVRKATSVKRSGRDIHTGEIKRTIEVPNLISPQHHWRCYRSKATDRYLLLPKRGVEFFDLIGDDHMRHNWLRPPCSHGVVPANGLLYVPPHQCFCYPGVKLTGYNALADTVDSAPGPAPLRLQQGPAYREIDPHTPGTETDWPTYRHDPRRSGHTASAVPAQLSENWTADLGGNLTPPIACNGRIVVAQKDAHRILCLDADTGDLDWSYTAGGRIDSAPTFHDGAIFFGCRDGYLYSLRASDGALAWRFRAAPDDRRIVCNDGLESAWPVHGSVLALDDVVYCTAGRSSYLDGGIRLYGLDADTGQLRYETVVDGPWPDVYKEAGRPFDMPGARSDILVTDPDHERLYMYQIAFDRQLNRVDAPRITDLGDRKMRLHLVATDGLVDDTWFDRTFWAYWDRWPGYYFTYDGTKAGQILAFDDDTVYALHVFLDRLRHSPAFTPAENGYKLDADAIDNEPVLLPKHKNREKGHGYSRANPPKWSKRVPVRAQAMAVAADTLFIAGPPDVVPEDDPYAAFDGDLGAQLWAISTRDGQKLAAIKLDTLPVFDGLIAANGRLYISDRTGRIICLCTPQ